VSFVLHNNNLNEANKQQSLNFDENQAEQELNPNYPLQRYIVL